MESRPYLHQDILADFVPIAHREQWDLHAKWVDIYRCKYGLFMQTAVKSVASDFVVKYKCAPSKMDKDMSTCLQLNIEVMKSRNKGTKTFIFCVSGVN